MTRTPKPAKTQAGRTLEHIGVAGPEGETRYLRFVSRDPSTVDKSRYGLDWWRTPVVHKGLALRLIEGLRAKLRGDS